MTRFQQLWKRIKNTISKFRLRKVAKTMIWVDDDLHPDTVQPANHDTMDNTAGQATHVANEKICAEAFPYNYIGEIGVNISLKTNQDIDFTRQDNLEEYFREMTVTIETLQSWISAGILSPHEVRIAENWIKMMRAKDREQLRKRDN
jgi:hypothetical protein